MTLDEIALAIDEIKIILIGLDRRVGQLEKLLTIGDKATTKH